MTLLVGVGSVELVQRRSLSGKLQRCPTKSLPVDELPPLTTPVVVKVELPSLILWAARTSWGPETSGAQSRFRLQALVSALVFAHPCCVHQDDFLGKLVQLDLHEDLLVDELLELGSV